MIPDRPLYGFFAGDIGLMAGPPERQFPTVLSLTRGL